MTRNWLVFVFLLLLTSCRPQLLEQTQDRQRVAPQKTELRVGTLYGPQIYTDSGQGLSGFDYEMAQKFADFLKLSLNMIPYQDRLSLYDALKRGEIDLIAAGMSQTQVRQEQFRLGPPLYYVNQVLVYREGTPEPQSLEQLDGTVTIIADSAAVEALTQQKKYLPSLVWDQIYDKDSEELLAMIASGDLKYTIVDSTSVQINRRYLPELRSGPVLAERQAIVWLLPPKDSDPLMSQLLAFWHQEQRAGTLDYLNEKYFGHVKRFDYVDTRAFIKAVGDTLPQFRPLFETHAGELDWRKLAATAYQESHWDPNARSPTGVRGLMMLTEPTARQLGIRNRVDPEQSIRGGAQYLREILQRLPESIPESERMWFALASYNMGMAHVEDARKLAEGMGLNPSAWRDLKQVLPLLQKRKYYQKTRYGYARGNEALHYVENIRRYYDTLVWLDSRENQDSPESGDEMPPATVDADSTDTQAQPREEVMAAPDAS